jgi:hypothetical protein
MNEEEKLNKITEKVIRAHIKHKDNKVVSYVYYLCIEPSVYPIKYRLDCIKSWVFANLELFR